MKMCYRGVSYDYNPTQIKLSSTTNPVKFRGHTYELNSVALNLKESDKEDIVYRGVALSEAKQTRFLGQICQKSSLGLTVVRKQTRFLGQVCDNNFVTLATTNATV